MKRADIHLVAENSDLPGKEVDSALRKHVYPGPSGWTLFLERLCLGMGTAMTLAGVVFFFAYNWQDLHKFFKLGLIAVLLPAVVLPAIFLKAALPLRMTLLTAGAVLTGVWFAVFGQIYQTGADAFDFFLAWTLFITIWVVVARFPPLWLLYLVLCNITYGLYTEQAVSGEPAQYAMIVLFLINAVFAFLVHTGDAFFSNGPTPRWLRYSLVLASACFLLAAFSLALYEASPGIRLGLSILFIFCFMFAVCRYGLRKRELFYLIVAALEVIAWGIPLLFRITDDHAIFLPATLYVMAGLFIAVRYLTRLQKKWKNEPAS